MKTITILVILFLVGLIVLAMRTIFSKNNILVKKGGGTTASDDAKQEKQKTMKTIDLSKVTIQSIDGTETTVDVAKELAQVIFANTQSIEEHSFSLDLYKNPVVELTDRNRGIIEAYIEKYFKAYIKVALKSLL